MGFFGSTTRFVVVVVVVALPFPQPRLLNHSHSGMERKISFPCTSQMTKTSLTVFNDDVTSGSRNVEQNEAFFSRKPNLADGKVS